MICHVIGQPISPPPHADIYNVVNNIFKVKSKLIEWLLCKLYLRLVFTGKTANVELRAFQNVGNMSI